jgi:ribose 5-phosphate isomerase B
MKVYFASDHTGFDMKNTLTDYVYSLGYEVEDCGAKELNKDDDYPAIILEAVKKVATDISNGIVSRAIIFGGSGQGEAMVANRIKGIRAAVYYGEPQRMQQDTTGHLLDIIHSSREHNNANVLSLGSRFLSIDEAKKVVKEWLAAPFTGEERHGRRIRQIDDLTV